MWSSNRHLRSVLIASALFMLLLSAIPIAAQTTCHFETIDVPGTPYGINKWGTVVGTFRDSLTGPPQAYRWNNNNLSTYLYPGSEGTEFYGINDLGDIVGRYFTSGGVSHGLVRSGGKFIPFDVPGAYSTTARGINRYGTIVGFFSTSATSRALGFRKRAGGWTTLKFPNSSSTAATAVSDTGEVVGSYVDEAGFTRGFSYKSGIYTTIDFKDLPNIYTEINGVNKYGSLVGQYTFISDDPWHGWQRKGGAFRTIDYPNALTTVLTGINNLGDEVGAASLAGEINVRFLRICR